MTKPLSRLSRRALTLVASTSVVAGMFTVPAHAHTAIDAAPNVLISEVYGGGGNSGAPFTHDFVELYNPTGQEVSLDGWEVEYFSASGGSGGSTHLAGSIAPGGYFLIQQGGGNGNGQPLPTPDAVGSLSMAGKQGSVQLRSPEGVRDTVGYGKATVVEGSGAPQLSNTTSAQRTDPGTDTDNNAADFHARAPTPQASGNSVTVPDTTPGLDEPADPPVTVDPTVVTAIAEIQGVGPESPLQGHTVTTEGVVTAIYPDGGLNGFFMQTAGTGAAEQTAQDASHGIFVYMGKNRAFPEVGQSVKVTGTVGEHFTSTQLSNPTITPLEDPLSPITPVALEKMPAGDDIREAYEGMLVQPTGAHTVTNNYELNTFGTLQLAPGTEAYVQPSDVELPSTDPNSPLQQLAAEQAAEIVNVDDGRSNSRAYNYMNEANNQIPLPWITQNGAQTITPIRTGDGVDFQNPVVFAMHFNNWTYLPQQVVTGNTSSEQLPITWENSRPAALAEIDQVPGDFHIASFNVLNYFTSLGKNEDGCGAYTDVNGNPVAANRCTVRGAYSEQAFQDQQKKIVAAINRMDVDVLGLEEIENTASVTGDASRRDEALAHLVDELNAAAGTTRWAYVPSPTKLGTNEDVIRVGFIYNPATVKPIGESTILDDQVFTGTARQPLVQKFATVTGGNEFVAVVNHFKSKGSVARGDKDTGDGQGNNANLRTEQSRALLEGLAGLHDSSVPTFILGDLNAYSREDAVRVIEQSGYTNLAKAYDAGHSYQFSGRLGSLDHALANAAATALAKGATVWNINADESIAFEYSRRNYNAVDYYQDDAENIVFRASDHDPIKVGFSFSSAQTPDDTDHPAEPSGSSEWTTGSSVGGLVGILFAIGGLAALLAPVVKQLMPQIARFIPGL
ncbi:predicted extracellular nuclease [Corynebacterium renale]|uniref:ExeM/NucH family extracellular endonuclease n=1 Tax=Corynebacterium renale TaxID=1724 RepID=UPI000DA41AB9|nr:ExeM/NucH family extracellular endonuclease [Corynebacterium renale]SQG65362.1 predicted extracellular nuclease [Corynebacterium renale]STC98947.1 predicted extracellular nuclease [Corynebacterium renale]